MKTENRTFKVKGKSYSGTIVWPSNLAEALQLLGEVEMWEAFKVGYLEYCRRQICGLTPRRRKIQKIDVSDLPDHEQEAILLAVDQMRQIYQQQRAKENAPPVQQSKAQIDSDEKPEEVPQDDEELSSASQSESSFEEDFAKYLASLDS